jgi:hypothetical protein
MGGERVWGDGTLRGDVPVSGTMVCGDAAEVLFSHAGTCGLLVSLVSE